MVGLGQAKTAHPLARRQFRQVFLPLRFAAEILDRIHHEARLHTHRRAVAAVDALDLARDQAVTDVVDAGAAVTVDGRAEKAERAHLVHDLAIKVLAPVGFDDARQQLVLAIGAGAVAHHALVLAELILEQQRIGPIELRRVCRCRTSCGTVRSEGGVGRHRDLGGCRNDRHYTAALQSAGQFRRAPFTPLLRDEAKLAGRRSGNWCYFLLALGCRPEPRPRPIFLAKADRCSA